MREAFLPGLWYGIEVVAGCRLEKSLCLTFEHDLK